MSSFSYVTENSIVRGGKTGGTHRWVTGGRGDANAGESQRGQPRGRLPYGVGGWVGEGWGTTNGLNSDGYLEKWNLG